jgi:hypothetical protein
MQVGRIATSLFPKSPSSGTQYYNKNIDFKLPINHIILYNASVPQRAFSTFSKFRNCSRPFRFSFSVHNQKIVLNYAMPLLKRGVTQRANSRDKLLENMTDLIEKKNHQAALDLYATLPPKWQNDEDFAYLYADAMNKLQELGSSSPLQGAAANSNQNITLTFPKSGLPITQRYSKFDVFSRIFSNLVFIILFIYIFTQMFTFGKISNFIFTFHAKNADI